MRFYFLLSVASAQTVDDGVFRQLQIDAEYSDFTTADADLAPSKRRRPHSRIWRKKRDSR